MLKTHQIHEIHRLAAGEHWSMRRITRHLHLAARTVKKYLQAPVPAPTRRPRASKLDPFNHSSPNCWSKTRASRASSSCSDWQRPATRGAIRFCASTCSGCARLVPRTAPSYAWNPPGERFETDWGHFGALDYQGDQRKLYAFVFVEAHSRMLYVEFIHSQSFETFVRCHQHAFRAMGGVAREGWYDNLLTVVAEHVGRLVRFNPRSRADPTGD